MPDRPDYFRCSNCHSTGCQRVVVRKPNGTLYETIFFSCSICTLVFLDPLAFTRGFEDRPESRGRADTRPAIQAWSKINQRKRERE